MLDLSTAVLCHFAQVRDRLLFVSSGAVSRLYRQELPSPLGLMVGLVIEVPLEDAGMEHRLRAEVINRHGTVLATLDNTFRVSDAGLFPHEVQQVPLVLSITGVRARTWGTHQVRLYLDEDLVRALTLYVVPAAAPQAAVRATPTQSRVGEEGTLGTTGAEIDQPQMSAADTAGPTDKDDNERQAAVPWGEPSGPDPEPGSESDIGLDLDPVLDLAVAPAEEATENDLSEHTPDADRQPTPAFRTPTIDAPTAGDDDPSTEAVPMFDFEGDESAPEDDGDDGSGKEPSRFSFRYRYEDDE